MKPSQQDEEDTTPGGRVQVSLTCPPVQMFGARCSQQVGQNFSVPFDLRGDLPDPPVTLEVSGVQEGQAGLHYCVGRDRGRSVPSGVRQLTFGGNHSPGRRHDFLSFGLIRFCSTTL
ncbi:LOW QUALITY PROTEIN: hypothetical protein CRUP_010042 [Coryphaenoides rupestris]|nr:LOW QUALITY PROTEIN: hypothetical protein CRUP_010042 [Coryphaenoides rupestris]